METHAYAVGAAVAAGGGVHIHVHNLLFAVFFFYHPAHLMGKLRGIAMADADAVGGNVLAQFAHFVHQEIQRFGTSFGRSNAHHLAFLAHVDEGAYANEGTHGGGKAAHPAAAAEEFEVIGKEIHGKLVHFRAGPFQHLVQCFTRFYQVTHLAHNGIAEGGDTFGVYLLEARARILFLKERNGLVHGVEGVGHRAREMHVQDVVPGHKVADEIVDILLFGDGTGGGKDASAKGVVEGVRIEAVKIHIRIRGFCVDAVGHRNERITVLGRQSGRHVGIGVGVNF